MQNLVSQLAQQFGLKSEQVQAGVGVLLQLIQEHAGKAEFQELISKIPGAGAMLAVAQSLPQQSKDITKSGNLLGKASSLLETLGGGSALGGLAGVIGKLEGAGFSADSAAKFVPAALDQLRSSAGPDTTKAVLDQVPALKGLAGGLLGKLLG